MMRGRLHGKREIGLNEVMSGKYSPKKTPAIVHTPVPIERGMTIPIKDLDRFFKGVKVGQVIKVPPSGFSASWSTARGFGPGEATMRSDSAGILVRLHPLNGKIAGLHLHHIENYLYNPKVGAGNPWSFKKAPAKPNKYMKTEPKLTDFTSWISNKRLAQQMYDRAKYSWDDAIEYGEKPSWTMPDQWDLEDEWQEIKEEEGGDAYYYDDSYNEELEIMTSGATGKKVMSVKRYINPETGKLYFVIDLQETGKKVAAKAQLGDAYIYEDDSFGSDMNGPLSHQSDNKESYFDKTMSTSVHFGNSETAREAHEKGLTYKGFGHWADSTGKTVAKTVKGKLVPVNEEMKMSKHTIVKNLVEAIKHEKRWQSGDPMPVEVKDLIAKYAKNESGAIKQISAHGRGEGIKSNKPKDGIWAYVWRMARFHSGIDPRMPVTATWDLSSEIEKQTGWYILFGILSPEEKQLLNQLDELVDRILPKLGLDPMGAAKRWGKAFGWL